MAILNGQLHGNEPVAMDREAFQRIFVTALLLTGSAAKAECSALEGIGTADQGDESGDALLYATLRAAIAAPVGWICIDRKHGNFLYPVSPSNCAVSCCCPRGFGTVLSC